MKKKKSFIFFNILGAGKNGKTFLGSLLDNHPSISTFPMEMKFIEHLIYNNKNINYQTLENFLLKESKLKYLNNKKNNEEDYYIKELKRLTIGNLEKIKFDHNKFIKIIRKNLTVDIKNSKNLKDILIFFHECLNSYFKKKVKKIIIVMQDGIYGLRNVNEQIKYLDKVKFIVMVRNPLDVFVISKKIAQNLKFFRRFIGSFIPAEVRSIRNNEDQYNYHQVNKLFLKYRHNPDFMFLKYEDLVTNPEKIMKKVANFFNINYSKKLIKPTVFGQSFDCRLKKNSNNKKFYTKEINQYKKHLKIIEIEYLKIKYQDFLYNFKYSELKKYSFYAKFKNLIQIYLFNILEANKYLPKNNYLIKMLYYIGVLNNIFLFKNFYRIIIK